MAACTFSILFILLADDISVECIISVYIVYTHTFCIGKQQQYIYSALKWNISLVNYSFESII